jgi:hypothetical protein
VLYTTPLENSGKETEEKNVATFMWFVAGSVLVDCGGQNQILPGFST